jgi:predicted transporter
MVSDFARERLRPLTPGVLLAFASIAFGFGLGIAFGAAEDDLKDHLHASAQAVLESVYAGDESQADSVVSKSWTYFKRAHLHANGLGTTALVAILLLALLGPPGVLERLSSVVLGAGALFYSAYWLVAGLIAPEFGSTSAAKEALAWLAIPSSGACVAGLAGTLICSIRAVLGPRRD